MKTNYPIRASALALAALLAACGSGGSDNNAGQSPVSVAPPPPAPSPPVAAVPDAFLAYVSQQAVADSDSTEPASVDGVNITTLENTEPQQLPGS